MANSFVQAAKKVLQTEADALETLKNDLPNDFSDLVKLILNLNGRVIVSGVGKSGHIGNKIAATLASTGTCLLYTSPSPRDFEASRMPSSA